MDTAIADVLMTPSLTFLSFRVFEPGHSLTYALCVHLRLVSQPALRFLDREPAPLPDVQEVLS